MKFYYIYILKCSDSSYYTGVKNNVEKRLVDHNSGDSVTSYTFKRRPVELVYYQKFNDIKQAIELEKQIKGRAEEKKKR